MSDLIVKRRQSTNFSSLEIQACLEALAINGGDVRRTQEEREAAGLATPTKSTLHRWKTVQYPEEYQRIKDKHVPIVYAELAEANERVAMKALDIEERGLHRLSGQIDSVSDPVEGSRIILNVSKTKGIAEQRASLTRGMPTEITAKLSASELARQMQRIAPGVIKVIESTAEEITE